VVGERALQKTENSDFVKRLLNEALLYILMHFGEG
jgi:hypothetical protein